MPRQGYHERSVQKVVVLKERADGLFEVNTSQGVGADVNVTNPHLYVRVEDDPATPSQAVAKENTLAALKARADLLGTEATLQKVLDQLDDATADTVLSVLKTLAGKDFATQTTLADVLAAVDGLEAKDYSTEATLSGLRSDLAAEDFATEATLELVRAQTALVAAQTDAIEALLTTIRDEQHRRTDPLATGSNIVGHVSPTVAKKVGEGKFYVAGAAINVGGLGSTDRASFRLHNPTGSGKVLYLVKATVYSSVTQQVRYNDGGTLTNPTLVTPRNINRAASDSSVAQLSHSISAPTGGTDWPNESRVQSSSPLSLEFPPMVLPPGSSFIVRGTTGDAQTFTANAYWYEE